ncbi:hypothetical protein MXB_3285, partial [Myxobolus squamalis]
PDPTCFDDIFDEIFNNFDFHYLIKTFPCLLSDIRNSEKTIGNFVAYMKDTIAPLTSYNGVMCSIMNDYDAANKCLENGVFQHTLNPIRTCKHTSPPFLLNILI